MASREQSFQVIGDKLVRIYQRLATLCDGFPSIVKDAALDTSMTTAVSSNCQNIILTIQDHERKRIFMGSTSFGKSTFVNAFLRKEVLPAGLGSTTSQVLRIRGTEAEDFIVKIRDAHRKKQEFLICLDEAYLTIFLQKSFRNLDETIAYISQWNEDNQYLMHEVDITLPLSQFPMLADHVVLIDSPGLGHEMSYNNAVQATSGSVRSLILLVDIEGDFSLQDMEYIKALCHGTTTAVPYIVMNKWDKAEEQLKSKPEKKETLQRKQMQRCLTFLVEQLGLSQQDARGKVFFLSGRRALESLEDDKHRWARDSYDDFFGKISQKENEAMCMKNVPEHEKDVKAMLEVVEKRNHEAVQTFEEHMKEKSQDLKDSETLNKTPRYKSKQLQVKLADVVNKSVSNLEERIEHDQINQERATNLIFTFIDEVGADIGQEVMAEIQTFTSEVNDEIIRLLPPNSHSYFITSSSKFSKETRSFEVDFSAKARTASNWEHFKNVEQAKKDVEERKENMHSIKGMFKVEKERAKALLVAERDTRLATEVESITRREEKEISKLERQRDAEFQNAEQECKDEIHKAEQTLQNAIIEGKKKKVPTATLR